MARGFASVHPDQEKRLKRAGVVNSDVTQGWGHAKASAGSHRSVGTNSGRKFAHCIDLSFRHAPTREHFDALVDQGFVPFLRFWSGNEHWHIVDVAWIKDDDGKVPSHLPLPRNQIRDFLEKPARNGLRGHAHLPKKWAPTADQQAYLRHIFESGKTPGQKTTKVKVIEHGTNRVVATYDMVPGGNHIDDPKQRKLYVTGST